MKTRLLFLVVIFRAAELSAGPAEDVARRSRERSDAITLLQQGKLAESRQLLNPPPSGGSTSTDIARGRQWVRIAFHFHARGERLLARQAASEAISLANIALRTSGTSSERASFLTNAGLLSDRILRNPTQAKSFYDAAVVAQPNSQTARQLQRITDSKLKQQTPGRMGGS